MIILTACDISVKAEEQRKVSGSPNLAGAYQEMNTPEFWISGIAYPDEIETRYIGETPLDSEYYETLLRNRNEESVGEQNFVRLGVIVRNTELRTWPTSDVSYDLVNDIEFDLGCETVLKTFERVTVLHESTDKKWLYVHAYNYIGWAKAEDVAFCTEDVWKIIGENTDWLTVTGNRIILDRVPQSLDVTVGFLEYTPRNVIELPRNASSQAAVAGARVDVSNQSDVEKQELILRQPVGTMLEFKGHIMRQTALFQRRKQLWLRRHACLYQTLKSSGKGMGKPS